MKRIVAILISALIMATTTAFAAAPAAPVFSQTASYTKVADGDSRAWNKPMVIDGANVFIGISPYEYSEPNGGNWIYSTKKIARSKDGGLTWEGLRTIVKTEPGNLNEGLCIAVSGTTTKIVHAVWPQYDGINWGLFYSWANNADLTAWSTPVKITGSVIPQDSTEVFSMQASKTGVIHVTFLANDGKLYYTTAAGNSSVFAEPTALLEATNPDFPLESLLDSSNNLHTIYRTSNVGQVMYTKLPAGATKWTAPKPVNTSSPLGVNDPHIAAYDANNLYVAFAVPNVAGTATNVDMYSSTNGGSSWSKSTVATNTSTNGGAGVGSIAVSKTRVLAIAYQFGYNGGASADSRFIKSADGKTWSAATVNPGPLNQNTAYILFDANNKINAMSNTHSDRIVENGQRSIYFMKEK
jgi:hypothetical protein